MPPSGFIQTESLFYPVFDTIDIKMSASEYRVVSFCSSVNENSFLQFAAIPNSSSEQDQNFIILIIWQLHQMVLLQKREDKAVIALFLFSYSHKQHT